MTKDKKNGKKGLLSRLKLFSKGIARGLMLVHIGTQIHYTADRVLNELNPSQQRIEFRQEFGFPIRGYREDIENPELRLSNIIQVLNRERAERPFNLTSINVSSSNYLKRPAWHQFFDIVSTGFSAYFNPFTDSIVLERTDCETITHEIKHTKTFEIIKKHPELLEKWRALSCDSNGNSMYLSIVKGICLRFRCLEKLVDDENKSDRENERLGFISNYAKTNVYEDIGELCAEASVESTRYQFRDLLDESSKEYSPRIAAKIRLAEEYGLIPEDFSDFIRLGKEYSECWYHGGHGGGYIGDKDKAKKYLEASERFLRDNPETIYEIAIRSDRGYMLQRSLGYDDTIKKEKLELAIEEYKLGLNAGFKEPFKYLHILRNLAECYSQLRDQEKRALYNDAYEDFIARIRSGNVKLIVNGMNDYLTSRGLCSK